MPPRDPDDLLVVTFKQLGIRNPIRSKDAGRDIYDDIEVCEIRAPGAKDVKVFPATAFSRWIDDHFTGEQTKQSYAERFRHQYRQFKEQATQTKTGTPLDLVPFLSEGRKAELRALNVYTAEQLAAVEGNELKNLGPGGREMKNKAIEFIDDSKAGAPNLQMADELAAMKARNAVLEEDVRLLAERAREAKLDKQDPSAAPDNEFDNMSLGELRDYITTHTGRSPLGSMNRKTLVRMATDARPDKVA